GFITLREQQLAQVTADSIAYACSFYGGYADAARKIFAADESADKDFPLSAITFFFRKQDSLTHRNFLGTLMSLGISRDLIGDIKVGQGEAVIFLSSAAVSLVLNEVTKIGKVGIRAEEGIRAEIPPQEYEILSQTVSSLRADAVVSAVCGISREKSSSLIRSGSVVLSGVQLDIVSDNIEIGEIFSVKGYGKYILSEIGNTTKKGKVHITIKKYK
ncbi:MAG: RNA-binding protein, partial [Ruminiclostridium sp.]|nr:RNA-binding protein [Ruminiclostridium sp.]